MLTVVILPNRFSETMFRYVYEVIQKLLELFIYRVLFDCCLLFDISIPRSFRTLDELKAIRKMLQFIGITYFFLLTLRLVITSFVM